MVPGSVPPWRAPCFAWPCRGFGLPGVFSWLCRGFLLPAARNRGAASEVASCSAIAQFFPFCSSRYKNLLLKLFAASRDTSDDAVRRRADFRQCSNRLVFLRGVAQAQLFAFAFPLARNFATGRLPLVPHCSRCLVPATHAHGCCCSQPFASRRAWLFLPRGFHRAPPNSVF